MRSQLLCTFSDAERLNDTIDVIIGYHDIMFDKIYVFSNIEDPNQLICTYNIGETNEDFITNTNTISLHRKKQTNTLYTINSLNEIIRSKNNGMLDKSFSID
jgi:hypothetical protein